MATNIEQIFRSFVVSKFREIQEEQQQQHGGGKVEGQPNGDTIPGEQANPSDDTGAGSRQNDQIVQKIEEVLSGALDTELQCKSDVDKNTVKNSAQPTKRSSTAEDEIPKKKSKKNKKHKSKKKKKKKKKRKKEKKHKKQPKESKLSTHLGDQADLQPASQLMPEKSSSQLTVQHGGLGDANLSVHLHPAEPCLKASEELDRQALGLVSHSRTDSQQSMENLGNEKGPLCATNPPFRLESSQSDMQENASITLCTREEQIKQTHENVYPVAINASEKGVLVTGNDTSSSILSGVANKSEMQKDSAGILASEVTEAIKGSEVILKCEDTGEIKVLHTTLESETMEVFQSEPSLQSVAQWGAKELEATSDSASLASDMTTITKSANQADLNTVMVAHVAVAMEEVKIPEATEKSLSVGSVGVLEEALQPVAVVKPQTLEKIIEPLSVAAEDGRAARECLQVEAEVVKDVEHTTDAAAVLNASGVLLQPEVLRDTGSVDRTQESALPAEVTDVNVVTRAECLRATSEPVAVVQTFIPQTTPEVQMAESFKGPQATMEVAPLAGVRGQEISQTALQLENTNTSQISNVRSLKATTLSLQKEDAREDMAGVETDSDASLLAMKVGPVRAVKGLETTVGPVAETEKKDSEAGWDSTGIETKASSSYLHMKNVRESDYTVSVGMEKIQALEAVLQPGTLAMERGVENVRSEAKIGSKVLKASPGLSALEEKSERAPESVVLGVSMEPVEGMMHFKTTAEREPIHSETGAESLGGSKAASVTISQSQVIPHTRTLQTELLREIKDSQLAASYATAEVRSLDNLSEAQAIAEVKDVEARSKTSHLTQIVVESETRTLTQDLGRRLASEAILEPVQTSEASSGSVQVQIGGCLETESFPKVEGITTASETVADVTNLKADEGTRGPTVQHIIASKRTNSQKNEPLLTSAKDLEEASEPAKIRAEYLDPVSKAREIRLMESMKETATVEVKDLETVQNPEMHMDIQSLETLQQSGNTEVINVGDDSEAVPESLHTEKQEYLQAFPEPKPSAEWKSTEEAPEILIAAEVTSSETVSKPDVEAALEHEVAAEAQYAEEMLDQQMEDVRVRSQSQECKILVEKEDAEQTQVSEPLIAETDVSFSHAVDEKGSAGTSESEIIRDTNHLQATPAHMVETKDLEKASLPETAVELKDAEAAVGSETEKTDLEAAPVPEIVTEAITVPEAEASQLEPQAEAVKEATPEQESEKRDSETSDVQPDVAARMKETLMRLEKVIEKSSHRSSDKKHDAKKQKRSRSKSQSRSRKRKKKSRSRSTSRRLASKRARSRSRNYSVSRKKRSKSRSPSVEKSERRVSSRRSRRRRSVSSDRYRSKSRSAEKGGSRLSSGRSRHRRSRSSDRYRSKSRSVEKRLSSRRSRRRRSRSSDRYRSKSRSVEKRLSSRRSGRRRSRSSDRYRSKSRSVEKRLSSRRSGRRRSRSSDRYRSKSRSAEKRLSSRRSGRRRSRSSDRYRSKSRSAEKRLSSRRSGRRRSRSSDHYRSKSRSVEKRGSRLSSWRSRRRRSRSSDRSKSRSRSWRFGHRGSGSSDRSKSRSRSVEKRGRKASLRRSKRQRSKSSDRYKSRSRSVEKRDRKQSSRKSKRQRSKSSDGYKSRSKSVEKKKESSRKSKRRRSKSSERYKSRSRSVEKKRKESSKKSKRKRSKSCDSVKSRSKSTEKRESKLSSEKGSGKHVKSSELQESSICLEKVEASGTIVSEGSSSKSSNGPMSVSLSDDRVNGPELPPASESEFSKTSDNMEETPGLQPSVIPELDSSKPPDDQESAPAEKTQVSELSMTSENGSAEKAGAPESLSLSEFAYCTSKSRSSSVEKDLEITELQFTPSNEDETRSTSVKEVEGPEPLPTLESGCSVSSDDYKTISSGKMGSSLIPESVPSDLSDGHELRHTPTETAELQKFLQVPESESSKLTGSPESFGTAEVQKHFLAPEVMCSVFPDVCQSASLPVETGQMQEPPLSSDRVCFRSPDGHVLGSSFPAQTEKLPLLSEDGSFKSPDGNEQRSLSVEKVKASDASVTHGCGPVETSDDFISPSSSAKMQEVVLTTAEQSCKSHEVDESSSCVDKGTDSPKLSQVREIDCSESSEMHELRYLPAGEMEGTGSVLMSVSGIPVCHDGRNSHNYFEKTESAELSLASAHGCSAFPEGYKMAYTTAEKLEMQKPSLTVESEFHNSADICDSVSTPTEKLQAPVTSLTSDGGFFLLPHSEEGRCIPDAEVEVQETSELKCIASQDGHKLRPAYDEETRVQESPVVVESRCSVSADGCELTSTAFEKVDVEQPSQTSENEYRIVLDGPELTSTPAEKTEMQELYQMSEERCAMPVESHELQSSAVEKTDMQEPALTPENEYAVSWEAHELRCSSPEKPAMQEASVVPNNEYAVSSEDRELLSSIAEKAEVQECSLQSENEYTVSPECQELTAGPAEKEVQQPSLIPDSAYPIFHEDQRLQSTFVENTVVQEPSLVSESQYAASPEERELHSTVTEKTEVQECSLLSENEYDVSPEGHDLRSSPVEKGEIEEPSETSESESSMSTDSQELQSTVVGRTEVQELSLMSEGECPMSPESQELQSSLAEKVEAKEPCLTSENEYALSHEEYESKLSHTEKTEDMDSSTSENDLLSFKSQEVRFTAVQNVDVQELSPIPENEHTASPDGQELRFLAAGKVGGLESLTLSERASMYHDDLKSIPVEKTDDAVPSVMPESGCSMSPDGYSVKSGPGEETGDLEPSLIAERRHSTSSYQEGHELKSPLEEEGLESLNSDHRRSVSPEVHDQKSAVDEEIDDLEPALMSEHRRSTSPDEHESRSSIEEAEYLEQPLTTERRCSVSSDEHESRSTTGEELEDAEPSLTAERRDSVSSDEHESRSTAGEDVEDGEPSLISKRRHSTSSDDRESRSTGEEIEDLEPVTADHRRSVSPDGHESRSTTGEEAEDQELSLTAERRHSTSSDEHESRSTIGEDVEDMEPSLTAERRDSTSSDERESQSTTGEEAEDTEPTLATEHRRSTSPDGRESRSTTEDDVEPSLAAERRDSTSSDDHESRSTTGEEGEDVEPSLADEDKQDSVPLERLEEQDSSFIPESRRSESSEREKSRSKSVDQTSDKESSQRSVSRHSKSPTGQKSRSTSVEKAADRESSRRSRRRRSRSTARQKSRSTSVEKADESSRRSRHRRSRSIAHQRSRSTSVEKATDKETSRRSRRRRSRSTARQRSQSKSAEKTADKESSRRSRSRRSRSSQRRSQRYDTESHSRRNRSRSVTRRRASRSRSNRRSRSSSLSRSRHRRRSRSRSASRRRRSLSRDRRKRSQRNRSRSTDRRRRRSDSRDRRISLRLRSRSRTPIRQRRSRSRGRRRSSSRSPIRLRRSRSSGRRRYSRSPDRRRSRSSERFSSRSPKRLTDLDKAQLLEIAKANAAAMCAKSGVPLPPSLMPLLSQKKDDKANQKSSRDTLKELTEKCKKIAQSTDDVIVNKPHVSDEEEEERPFYNHPFKLSEPKPIFFNLTTPSIKPAPPPQPKNQVSLSKEFPVSSGSQHRKKEADSVYGEWVPVEKGKEDSKDDVFPKPSIEGVDITTAMNDRALAQKRLNENTFDLEAMCMLNRAQEQIDAWAQSNSIPGQFTGSTGAQILSSDELTNSGPQAWIRKDQFLRAAPVTGGMGAQLMRKMGWREGEGLGKNKEGSVEPIMVDFKTDRKGLVAVGEKAQKRSGHYVVMKDLSGKHPVSALMEICNKRRWSPPEFVLVDDSGPDHRKHFIFKVRVNGNEYRPTFASLNKKHAKATAATAALQAMGLVPKESMVNTTMFRSASHR